MTTWPVVELGEICKIVGGGTPKRTNPDYYGTDIPWVTPKDMKRWEISEAQIGLTHLGLENSAARLVPEGSVLIVVRSGVLKHTLPVGLSRVPVTINQDMKALLCNSDVEPDYLARYIKWKSPEILQWVRATTADNFSIDKLKQLEVPLPSILEQHRIVSMLDRADELRAKRREALSRINELDQSIYAKSVSESNALDFSIGELLDRGDLILHKDGNHGSLYPRSDEFGEFGVPFISAKAIADDGVLQGSLIERLTHSKANQLRIGWIQGGDVLLSHNASVGKVALYDGRFESALIGTSLTAFRPNPRAIKSEYLAATLRSDRFQAELRKNMSQTTRNQVPITAQRRLRVPIPSLSIQAEYADRASKIDALRGKFRTALKEFDSLFISLQSRAFQGEL